MRKAYSTKVLSIITIVVGMILLNSCQKEFTITVQSNNEAWGNVIGGGKYKKGTIVQLLATPATGYQFGKWDDGNTNNPRTITIERNAVYTAMFVAEGSGGEDTTGMPTLTTDTARYVTATTAVCGGNVTKDGGSKVTARGVCWSTSSDPTIENSHHVVGSGCGIFYYKITGLEIGTTYYVRTYATNASGTIYGNQISFTTLPGFSVAANRVVRFSPGNLQWSATNGGSTPTTHIVQGYAREAGTFRFAPNQWDTIGAGHKYISATYTGWIDLFGWGTSGYNNKYPYMVSLTETDYGNGENDITGTNYDWGVYNAIYNPVTQTTDDPGIWRTMTKDEWNYLLNTRPTSLGIRYAKGTVCGVAGLIIVPDNWNTSIFTLNNVNTANAAYTSNVINAADWKRLESAGCVFLPAAGFRGANSARYVGSEGNYWSTTYCLNSNVYHLYFSSGNLTPASNMYCTHGHSVRLVRDEK